MKCPECNASVPVLSIRNYRVICPRCNAELKAEYGASFVVITIIGGICVYLATDSFLSSMGMFGDILDICFFAFYFYCMLHLLGKVTVIKSGNKAKQ